MSLVARDRRRSPLLRTIGFVGTLAGAQNADCAGAALCRASRPRSRSVISGSRAASSSSRRLSSPTRSATLAERLSAARRQACWGKPHDRPERSRAISDCASSHGGARVFAGVFAARRDGRLRRDAAPHRRHQDVSALFVAQGHALSRAVHHRAHHAVRGAGRRDVLLPQSVAPARTGGRARGRHFGLAVHRAGASSSRFAARRRWRPRSTTRCRPRCANDRSGSRPNCSASDTQVRDCRRPASGCASAATTASRSSTPRPAASRASSSAA